MKRDDVVKKLVCLSLIVQLFPVPAVWAREDHGRRSSVSDIPVRLGGKPPANELRRGSGQSAFDSPFTQTSRDVRDTELERSIGELRLHHSALAASSSPRAPLYEKLINELGGDSSNRSGPEAAEIDLVRTNDLLTEVECSETQERIVGEAKTLRSLLRLPPSQGCGGGQRDETLLAAATLPAAVMASVVGQVPAAQSANSEPPLTRAEIEERAAASVNQAYLTGTEKNLVKVAIADVLIQRASQGGKKPLHEKTAQSIVRTAEEIGTHYGSVDTVGGLIDAISGKIAVRAGPLTGKGASVGPMGTLTRDDIVNIVTNLGTLNTNPYGGAFYRAPTHKDILKSGEDILGVPKDQWGKKVASNVAPTIERMLADPTLKPIAARLLNNNVTGTSTEFLRANPQGLSKYRELKGLKSQEEAIAELVGISTKMEAARIAAEKTSRETHDINERGKKAEDKEKVRQEIADRYAPFYSAVSTIKVLFPNSKEVQALAVVTEAAIQISELGDKMKEGLASKSIWGPYGIALSMFSTLFSMFSDEDPNRRYFERIIKEIENLSKDVKNLGQTIAQNHREVERWLDLLNRHLDDEARNLRRVMAREFYIRAQDHRDEIALLRIIEGKLEVARLEQQEMALATIAAERTYKVDQIRLPNVTDRKDFYEKLFAPHMGWLYVNGRDSSRDSTAVGTNLHIATGNGVAHELSYTLRRKDPFYLLRRITESLETLGINVGARPHDRLMADANAEEWLLSVRPYLEKTEQYPDEYLRWDQDERKDEKSGQVTEVSLSRLAQLYQTGWRTKEHLEQLMPSDSRNFPYIQNTLRLLAHYQEAIEELAEVIARRTDLDFKNVKYSVTGGYDATIPLSQMKPSQHVDRILKPQELFPRGVIEPCDGSQIKERNGVIPEQPQFPVRLEFDKYLALIPDKFQIARNVFGGQFVVCYEKVEVVDERWELDSMRRPGMMPRLIKRVFVKPSLHIKGLYDHGPSTIPLVMFRERVTLAEIPWVEEHWEARFAAQYTPRSALVSTERRQDWFDDHIKTYPLANMSSENQARYAQIVADMRAMAPGSGREPNGRPYTFHGFVFEHEDVQNAERLAEALKEHWDEGKVVALAGRAPSDPQYRGTVISHSNFIEEKLNQHFADALLEFNENLIKDTVQQTGSVGEALLKMESRQLLLKSYLKLALGDVAETDSLLQRYLAELPGADLATILLFKKVRETKEKQQTFSPAEFVAQLRAESEESAKRLASHLTNPSADWHLRRGHAELDATLKKLAERYQRLSINAKNPVPLLGPEFLNVEDQLNSLMKSSPDQRSLVNETVARLLTPSPDGSAKSLPVSLLNEFAVRLDRHLVQHPNYEGNDTANFVQRAASAAQIFRFARAEAQIMPDDAFYLSERVALLPEKPLLGRAKSVRDIAKSLLEQLLPTGPAKESRKMKVPLVVEFLRHVESYISHYPEDAFSDAEAIKRQLAFAAQVYDYARIELQIPPDEAFAITSKMALMPGLSVGRSVNAIEMARSFLTLDEFDEFKDGGMVTKEGLQKVAELVSANVEIVKEAMKWSDAGPNSPVRKKGEQDADKVEARVLSLNPSIGVRILWFSAAADSVKGLNYNYYHYWGEAFSQGCPMRLMKWFSDTAEFRTAEQWGVMASRAFQYGWHLEAADLWTKALKLDPKYFEKVSDPNYEKKGYRESLAFKAKFGN